MNALLVVYAAIAALVLSTQVPEVPETQVAAEEEVVVVSEPTAAPSQAKLIDQINQYRATHGLPAVTTNEYVCNFASLRAQELSQDFSHAAFDNRVASQSFPYPSYSLVTENIAMTSDINQVIDLWINSTSHAENMRQDTPYVCVGRHGDYYAYQGWRP